MKKETTVQNVNPRFPQKSPDMGGCDINSIGNNNNFTTGDNGVACSGKCDKARLSSHSASNDGSSGNNNGSSSNNNGSSSNNNGSNNNSSDLNSVSSGGADSVDNAADKISTTRLDSTDTDGNSEKSTSNICDNTIINSNSVSKTAESDEDAEEELPKVYSKYINVTTDDLFNGNPNVLVQKNVGSGYAGTVFKCIIRYDPLTNVEVALKVIPKEKVKVNVATNEAELLRAASAPNVLEFLNSFHTRDAYFIMTEYCSKGDLHSRLRYLDADHVKARMYMRDIICGLESLHGKFIVHADIKMRNILITDKNVAKLADFGFAKKYSSRDVRETICHGTRDYWAPEMMREFPSYDPFKADVYALGVTFVGVCEGRPIKLKSDNIHSVVKTFKDKHQVEFFRGLLASESHRWGLEIVKSNPWLNAYKSSINTPT